jgi:hypothetical protein
MINALKSRHIRFWDLMMGCSLVPGGWFLVLIYLCALRVFVVNILFNHSVSTCFTAFLMQAMASYGRLRQAGNKSFYPPSL